MIEKVKVINKYANIYKEYEQSKVALNTLSQELSLLDPKANRKAYKAKAAEVKSMNGQVIYFEKQLKKLQRKKKVAEYIKVLLKIKEFNEQFKTYDERNKELQLVIQSKEEELNKLKG